MRFRLRNLCKDERGGAEPLSLTLPHAVGRGGHPRRVSLRSRRAIAAELVDPARIAIRDQKSSCGVLFDADNREPVVRLYFDRREKQVGEFDAEKTETKHDVDGPEGLYRVAGAIRAVVKGYSG